MLEAADRLIAIGCFSVGTNQVDLDAARRRGIPVFNAPFSNTRSVAELVIGEIVMLLRRIVAAFRRRACRAAGTSPPTTAIEVRGKTLGIIGYGNIGSQLSNLAEALGMRVIFYDHTDKLRHGNTEPTASLRELLAQSDVVTLHVPETPATHGMIGRDGDRGDEAGRVSHQQQPRHGGGPRGARGRAARRQASRRGGRCLPGRAALERGAASCSPLQGLENVILTPHIGGSTEEAQERIGAEVARKLVDYSRCRLDDGRGQFPAGAAAAAADGRRASSRCSATCRACWGV